MTFWRVTTAILLCGLLSAFATESATVRGRVTTLAGDPLEGARVVVNGGGKAAETVSDKSGNYVVRGVAGRFELTAELRGFSIAKTSSYVASGGETVVDIGLAVGRLTDVCADRVSGTIQTPDKTPISSATVTVVACLNDGIRQQTGTDAMGHYEVTLLDGGAYCVSAVAPGFSAGSRTVAVKLSCANHKLDFQLQRP